MASFNRVILIGNLTRDVELRHTPAGTAVTDIGLAVNDRVKKGDQWVDEATFVDCTLFGRSAEVAAEYLTKGSPIFIEGRLKLESWDDKNTGKKVYKLKVLADKMQMLGNKGGGQATSAPAQQQSAPQAEYADASFSNDEIPF